MRRVLLMTAAIVALGPSMRVASCQNAPLWRTVELARQLRDSQPQHIRVQYGAGRVDVHSSPDPMLYVMYLRYDEVRSTPLHRYDADHRSLLLGLDSRGQSLRPSGGRDESGELRLAVPRAVPVDLDLEFGGTEATLELGGLLLQSLHLACGATDATLSFALPNRTRMRDLEISLGAAAFRGLHLANANADQIRLRGGVGSVDLDFDGLWSRDLAVSTQLVVGTLVIRVPSNVGVRVEVRSVAVGFEHDGLVKRDDAWYSENWDSAPHKLRLRARSVVGRIDIRRGSR